MKPRLETLFHVLTVVLMTAGLFAAPAPAGDIERAIRYWPRPNGQLTIAACPHGCPAPSCPAGFCCPAHAELFERWDPGAYAGGGLEWYLFVQPTTEDVAPGFFACGDATNAPGYDAVVSAAREWNAIPWPIACPSGGYQHVEPVPYGNPPPPPPLASDFAFRPDPVLTMDPGDVLDRFDGRNTVAFLDDRAYFDGNGGAEVVLAVSPVTLSANGQITDADVVLNASTSPGGPAYFSWVEENADGNVYATYGGGTPALPLRGFADVQGVLTHELGHVLGFGHSVVDSTASASATEFPTMAPRAQIELFSELVSFLSPTTCGVTMQASWSGSSTFFGGLLGRSARTLEPDDVAALGRVYPSADFPIETGTITGQVTANGTGVEGASVVAISKDCPDLQRFGALSYHRFTDNGNPQVRGTYTLSGLPPGKYFVFAESVDGQVYFDALTDLPGYLQVTPSPVPPCTPNCAGQCPCFPCAVSNIASLPFAPQTFLPELWNDGDQIEELGQLASVVNVQAGVATTNVNFAVDTGAAVSASQAPLLEVKREAPSTTSPYSRRGVYVGAGQPLATDAVTFRIQGQLGVDAFKDVTLGLRYGLKNVLVDGNQLRQVRPVGGPATFTGTLDGAARLELTYPIAPGDAFRNVYAQAFVQTAGNPSDREWTNTVNVWVTDPGS